ncbi:MAG: class I tRNA ligase family protein, partial [Chloroflexi bacterium]|nr:class I tRNA ligase family protein [Chloroflexota bacterium]
PHLDVHGGGQDLVFPHHENEIAQTEAYTGQEPFAQHWVHNGLLQMDQDKMSKSLGNLVTVRDALDKFGPDPIRLFFLNSHYHSPLAYSEDSISGQQRAADRLRAALEAPSNDDAAEGLDPTPYRERFVAAMDDDLNTPQALASVFSLARDINRGREEGKALAAAQECLRELTGILGLRLEPEGSASGQPANAFVELLAEVRQELRANKQFALADLIRSRLQELGVSLEDTPEGSKWRFTSN